MLNVLDNIYRGQLVADKSVRERLDLSCYTCHRVTTLVECLK